MDRKKIAIIFGTRPDAIKMAPVVVAIRNHPDYFHAITIATAQHRQMLDQVLTVFTIRPDYDLNLLTSRQTLSKLTSGIITSIDKILVKERPDLVLVQGDTTTTCIGSLAAFYNQIPVGHVEAGLRTNDKNHPFPEEINRRITGCIADLHFAPTETARRSLQKENIDSRLIFVTGNTGLDALKFSVKKNFHFSVDILNRFVSQGKRIILITMHRRENWGEPMENACKAIKKLALRYSRDEFVFPLHLNPLVRETVYPILGNIPNVSLIEPLDYLDFVNFMARSYIILTDSGGIQEEGPSLGIPVLVLRDVTERPEAIQSGTVRMVGMDPEKIFSTAIKVLDDENEYCRMARAVNPYGDGSAAERIIEVIKKYFGFPYKEIEEFNPVPEHLTHF